MASKRIESVLWLSIHIVLSKGKVGQLFLLDRAGLVNSKRSLNSVWKGFLSGDSGVHPRWSVLAHIRAGFRHGFMTF